jgi:hypothetical protein
MQAIIDFWNLYSGLFSDPDNKVRIAAWAATITTLSFIITLVLIPLIKWIKRKFAKVKVEAGISYQIVSSVLGTAAAPPLLTLTVTNLTGSTIYLNNPSIKSSRKINGNNNFVVPKSSGTFPRKLENGEQFKQDYDTISLNNQILTNLYDSDKIGFKITTTAGKTYSSNKFTKSHIIGHMNSSRRI